MTDTILQFPDINEPIAETPNGEPIYIREEYRRLFENMVLRILAKVDKTTITAITTDMAADAEEDELKDKINEVVAALV